MREPRLLLETRGVVERRVRKGESCRDSRLGLGVLGVQTALHRRNEIAKQRLLEAAAVCGLERLQERSRPVGDAVALDTPAPGTAKDPDLVGTDGNRLLMDRFTGADARERHAPDSARRLALPNLCVVFRLLHSPRRSRAFAQQSGTVDTIKMLARERHFYTADIRLAEHGHVVMIGDEAAVERIVSFIQERAQDEAVSVESEPLLVIREDAQPEPAGIETEPEE